MIFLLVSIDVALLLLIETLIASVIVECIRETIETRKIIGVVCVAVLIFTTFACYVAMSKLLEEYFAVI